MFNDGKKVGNKINIVFVCYLPQVWQSLASVCEECIKDDRFDVTIVAIPDKEQLPNRGFNHHKYISRNAEEFFTDFPCKVINGYNYKWKHFISLKRLKPDYIFFQTPYNVHRCNKYNPKRVSKYTKLLYVHYAFNTIGNGVFEECYPLNFFSYVYSIFTQSVLDDRLVRTYCSQNNIMTKVNLTGFPRYDFLCSANCAKGYSGYDKKRNSTFRVIWTPRWRTNEGVCSFFEYKDCLVDLVETYKDIDFIFRPHPLAFKNWDVTGELPEEEANRYKARYDSIPNAKIDYSSEYFPTFFTSDVLITDTSSIMIDYFVTGKPIIYCHKKDSFNDLTRKLSEGFYWVHNWEELRKTLIALKNGHDPLKEKRLELIKKEIYMPPQGAGYTIKEWIKRDYDDSQIT